MQLSLLLQIPFLAPSIRPFNFDPATALPWTVPLLVLLPVAALAVLLGGVRGRRAASGFGLFAVMVTIVDALLVAWALARRTDARATYQWMNIPVSATGDPRFQGFGIDVAFRVDHYAIAAVLAVLVVFFACLTWHRVLDRGPGPVRYQAGALLLLLCAIGAIVSGDIAEQLAFWVGAGAASYVLLSNRWGTEAYGLASRVALALPVLGDVALLCAVGSLYSNFASLDLEKIAPSFRTTPGVDVRWLTAAALLVVVAVAVRGGLWPFTAWVTAAVEQPASAVALVAGTWPAVAGVVLVRYLPLLGAAGPQARVAGSIALGAAAVLGPALALLTSDLRRSVLLASSGGVALGLLAILDAASTASGLTGLLAIGLGRAGAGLAAGTFVIAMRTADIRQMGEAWRLMRGSACGLAGSAAAIAAGVTGAAAITFGQGPARWPVWVAYALGIGLASVAVFRLYLSVAHGPLRRRRAFEPKNVREAAPPAVFAVGLAAAVGLVTAVLAFTPFWLAFLAGGKHDVGVGTDVLGLAPALIGLAIAVLAFLGSRKDAALAALGDLGTRYSALLGGAGRAYSRFVGRPGLAAVGTVETIAVPVAESSVGRAAQEAGSLAPRSLVWLSGVVVIVVAVVVIVSALGAPVRL